MRKEDWSRRGEPVDQVREEELELEFQVGKKGRE